MRLDIRCPGIRWIFDYMSKIKSCGADLGFVWPQSEVMSGRVERWPENSYVAKSLGTDM